MDSSKPGSSGLQCLLEFVQIELVMLSEHLILSHTIMCKIDS